jgi:DNA-binding transcriptional regulator GbsR (MarR family)
MVAKDRKYTIMKEINDEVQDQIRRILEVGAQWMGLQRTSGVVLSTLYIYESTNREQLSVKRMSELTGLSISTISSICSQLESLGIIVGQSDGSSQLRGRRKTVFSLRVDIQQLLQLGIKNYMNHVQRILRDIEAIRNETGFEDSDSHMTMDRVAYEITQFLRESSSG